MVSRSVRTASFGSGDRDPASSRVGRGSAPCRSWAIRAARSLLNGFLPPVCGSERPARTGANSLSARRGRARRDVTVGEPGEFFLVRLGGRGVADRARGG